MTTSTDPNVQAALQLAREICDANYYSDVPEYRFALNIKLDRLSDLLRQIPKQERRQT